MHADVRTVANTFGKKALPLFLPIMLLRLPFLMRNYDTLLLGDGVLAILGAFVKKILPHKRVVCIIHGLDITYENSLYQNFWVQKFLPTLDTYITVGNYTSALCAEKGLAPDKTHFVPNGIDPEKFNHTQTTKEDLWAIIGDEHRNKKIILTSGRLARRKGVAWFIHNVLPTLPENTLYIIAGDGPDKENIKNALTEAEQSERVCMLGYVSDAVRETLFHHADIFVQPNITVQGDVEGFGISVLEAAASGIPVIAADLEGLRDAITEGENGFKIESENQNAWQKKVTEVLSDNFDRKNFGQSASRYTTQNSSWNHITKLYSEKL